MRNLYKEVGMKIEFIYLDNFLRNFYKEVGIFGVEGLELKKEMIYNVEILFLTLG